MTVRIDVQPDGSLKPLAFHPATRAAIKSFPGVYWDRERHCYSAGLGPDAPSKARHGLEAARACVAATGVALFRGEPEPLPARHVGAPVAGLRDYQAVAANWLVTQCVATGAALLADDMGLGKTAPAIRAAEVLAASAARRGGFVLVVCPSIVARHWEREVKRWSFGGAATAGIVTMRPKRKGIPAGLDVPRTDFRIISYEMFRRHGEHAALAGASVVVVDEAHYLANARAKRTQALATYLELQAVVCGNRPRLIALTGTPLDTRPRDLYSLLTLMHPNDWGSFWQYTKRYCGGRYVEIPNTDRAVWESDGVSNTQELHKRLQHVMLRRSKAEVGGLPPRIRTLIPVELPARARKVLEEAAKEIDGFKGLARVLGITEAHKLAHACELATELIEAGRKPLIFTTRQDTAEAIAEKLGIVCVHGGLQSSGAKREEALLNAPAAVATMHSLTTGIPLTQFDCVIFCGLDWRPSVVMQAEARPHRIGQTKTLDVFFLVGLGTIDEMVQARVIERLELFDQAIGAADDGNELREVLNGGSDDDLLAELCKSVKKESEASDSGK